MESLIHYQWVETNEQLEAVCEQARKTKVVALDTEFIRTRTYYPILGLIQLLMANRLALLIQIRFLTSRLLCHY